MIRVIASAAVVASIVMGGCDSSDRSHAPGGPEETTTLQTTTSTDAAGEPVSGPECPAPEANAASTFDTGELVGLSVARAEALARSHGCSVRVTSRDGRDLPVTLDFQPHRIDVAVEDNEIVRITGVG